MTSPNVLLNKSRDMKILYAIPVMFLLSGCFYQGVPKFIIDKSEELCKSDGGITEIYSIFNGTYGVKCANGKYVHIGLE